MVHYTNAPLTYGQGDAITFDGYDNVDAVDYHSNWAVTVYNTSDESGGVEVSTLFGKSFDLDIIRYPYYAKAYLQVTNSVSEVTPNNIYASAVTNYVEYFLYNVSLSGNNLQQARFPIPGVMDTNTLLISNSVKTSGVTNYLSNGYVYLDYSVSNLKPGEYDRWWVVYADHWSDANTNVYWQTEAAFDTSYGLFRSTDEYAGKSLYVNYVMPAPHGQTYVTPKTVSQDYPFIDYTVFISNTATEENNLITYVDIRIPDAITNYASAISSNFGAVVVFSEPSAHVLRIAYTNTNFLSGMRDFIRIRGYDRISTNEYTTNWYVTVKNTSDASGGVIADTVFGKSTQLQIIRYPYSVQAYVEAVNPLVGYNKNVMSVTKVTNEFKFYIYNQSSTGNNLNYARIDIPFAGTEIDTNWLEISNLIRTSNVVVAVSNGAIYLDYSAQPLQPQQNDVVRLRFRDNISTHESAHTWNVFAAFNTTYDLYKTASVYSGKKLTMDYDMPIPAVTMGFTPEEIYLNRSEMWIALSVTNSGEELNRLDQVRVTIPTAFVAGTVSNSIADSYDYTGGVLTLNYSDFRGGTVDRIYLQLSNVATNKGATYITAVARNYVHTNAVEGNETFTVLNMPTYYVYPNEVDTADTTNSFEIYINNDINGNSSIKQVILEFPAPVSGLAAMSSYLEPQLLGIVTSLTLDYELATNEIIPGDYDIVTLDLIDNLEMGSTAITVNAYLDNGDGLVPFEIKSGKSADIQFTMSEPQSTSGIDPNSVSLGMDSNRITVSITNNGSGTSRLTYARMILPEGFTDIADYSSSRGATVTYNAFEHRLEADYRSDMIEPGESDSIVFEFENTVFTITNLNLRVETANLTNNPAFVVSPGEMGDEHVISISYPPLFAEGYFSSQNKIYIIETNAQLTYRIVNRSYQTELTQAVITFDTNVFEKITLSGDRIDTQIDTGGATQFRLDFTDNPLEFMEAEDLTLNIDYALDMLTDITLSTRVWVIGGTNADFETIAVNDKKSYIQITNSTWGLVQGTIVPEWRLANVKIYQTGTSNISTNVEGNNLAGISDVNSGIYQLSRIPAGIYDLEFTAPYYRALRVSNIQIFANQMTMVSIVTMRNAPLSSESGDEVIYSYEDTNTFVTFPEGAVGDAFSLDIVSFDLTHPQRTNTLANNMIAVPGMTNGMWGYQFVLNDFDDFPLEGVPLEMDAVLTLSFDTLEMENRGWNASQLGIYYWDDGGANARWISMGGTVHTSEEQITAQVSYLHEYYAVFEKGTVVTNTIGNVEVRPKIFTPDSEDGYYNSIRISFEFNQDYSSYEVKIYSLKGQLVRKFERNGSYVQGEVVWDAKDEDGYIVDSGVYIYQVKAGDAMYSGTLIIAR